MYQSSAYSGVLYVTRYLFLNILLGIPLTITDLSSVIPNTYILEVLVASND
jgi:hypothetical protein